MDYGAPRFYATYSLACGRCWLGPTCRCEGVQSNFHKIKRPVKHLLTFGKDYSDPAVQAEIDAGLAEFIRQMRYISGRSSKAADERSEGKNGNVGSGKT